MLNASKKLIILNLGNNKIENIRELNAFPNENLQELNLNNNRLEFYTEDEFLSFVNQVKNWTRLRILDIDENPYQLRREQYEHVIEEEVTRRLRLEMLNGKDMGELGE